MQFEELFEALVGAYCGPLVVIRQLPSAAAKIYQCVGSSAIELVKKLVKQHGMSNLFVFEDFDRLATLLSSSLEYHLVDSLTKSDLRVGERLEEVLEEGGIGCSEWFYDWSLTLATLLRIGRHKKFEVALERNGVLIFVDKGDDLGIVRSSLADYKDFPMSLIYFTDSDSRELADLMAKSSVPYLILKPGSEVENDPHLAEFLAKFLDSCSTGLESGMTPLRATVKNTKLTSKILKAHDGNKTLIKYSLLMCEELATGQEGTIVSVLKSNLDDEIQALSQLLFAIYLHRHEHGAKVEPKQPLDFTSEEEDRVVVDSYTVITHFDKAITLFNKYGCQWESFLTSILSVLVGDDEEVNKLLAKNSLLELKSKSDHSRAALCMELSSRRCTRRKKKKFQLVMAGHLFNQAGMQNLSKLCYLSSLGEYDGWDVTLEHLYSLLGTFDENFLINCLNILSNNYENKHSSQASENFDFIPGLENKSKGGSDKEIYYLKRLVKLASFKMTTKYLDETPISGSFHNYPTIYYQQHELPELEGTMPFLVRVPIIYLRKNGIIGTNIRLTTNYVDDLYEKLLKNSFDDHVWQRCMKFNNIKDHVKKDLFLSNGASRGPNYMKGTKLNLSVTLLNPVNVPVDCYHFKILVLLNPNFGNGSGSGKGESSKEIGPKPQYSKDDYAWFDCEIKSQEKTENFYLKEHEKRDLVLTFEPHRVGSFKIVGVSWKLFNCVYFWSPVYTVGKKLRSYEHVNRITLPEFIAQRAVDKTLYFTVYEDRPKVKYFFRKLSDLTCLAESDFFLKRDYEFLNYDGLVKDYVEKYAERTVSLTSEDTVIENENLCLFDFLNGEAGVVELFLRNLEDNKVDSVVLKFKVLGTFKVPPYPVSHKLEMAFVTSPSDYFKMEEGKKGGKGTQSMVDCSWNLINLPNVKVRDESLMEKMYEVTIKFKDQGVDLHRKSLSIYMFLEPLRSLDGIALIEGSFSVVPPSGLDLLVPFKLFLRVRPGPTFNANFNYKDVVKVHVNNRSKEEITNLDFSVNDESVNPTSFSDLSGVPPRTAMNFILPLQKPIEEVLSPCSPPGEKVTFGVFWNTVDRFGVFSGKVDMMDYKLLVKISTTQQDLKFSDDPIISSLTLTLQNLSSEKLETLSVYPVQDYESESLVSFIGVTRRNVSSIEPGKSVSLDFQIVIPLPGVYHFSPLHFKLDSSLEDRHVVYHNSADTLIVYD